MKTRIAAAIASLFVASLGTAAFAQQTTPQQTPPPANSAYMNNSGHSSNNMMSSSQVEQKIKRALSSHGVTATHVNVQFNDGTATLSGTVFTKQDIAKAKSAAMQVHGVKHVDTSGLQARTTSQGHQGQG
ncbi:MAG: BON domain-containing protein [Rhodanobacteraceae bacterium]